MPSRVLVSLPAAEDTAVGYSVVLATEPAEVRAAQRLRHRVFAAELGATLGPASGAGIDADRFDPLCDHLLIRDDRTGECVGTYRMLPPGRSAALYAEGEFHLERLARLRPTLVETGRSCVHPDHRTGAVIGLMWAGLCRYVHLSGHRWLAGCASVPLADGGVAAAASWEFIRARHLAPEQFRVTPLNPWRPADGTPVVPAKASILPPLLRGYLRLGARVAGAPAHDPDFGTADFYVLLAMSDIDPRYLRRFLGDPT